MITTFCASGLSESERSRPCSVGYHSPQIARCRGVPGEAPEDSPPARRPATIVMTLELVAAELAETWFGRRGYARNADSLWSRSSRKLRARASSS
jgi:hypothetical protein